MGLKEVQMGNLEHRTNRTGWLRAAVLGSNDGLVSTASLMIGVAAANKSDLLITAGLAGIAAGAMSMAVGEYVSVKSQTDIEKTDREIEIRQLRENPEGELAELIHIYTERGLSEELATSVANALHEKDALEAHLRDELGYFDHTRARPIQAGIASAIAFTAGGVIPLIGALLGNENKVSFILIFTAIGLIVAGVISARIALSSTFKTTARIFAGGTLGVAITAGIGWLVGLTGI
ncbi:MAG: VIT family protein [Actinomycetota bacterium]|nr:VIT family protein [Actinomycetota bacterium]MDA2997278.1 VIT family protein [Actinomycetota bacterium]MDA3035961.1 VIT family protein [Actinomycetota bacterium]